MAGKFEIFKDKAGKNRWRLKANNGEIILASQAYASRAGALVGIASVRKNSNSVKNFRVTATRKNSHRFNLVAGNGQVIGTSQSYKTAASCKNGVNSVKRSAPKAKVASAVVLS